MSSTQPTPETMIPHGLHHIAYATRDSKATYDFYHNKLGMPLCLTENHRHGDGYFRHFFFDMGQGELLGFFEVHGVGEKEDFRTEINATLGLPPWINHIAFDVENEEAYQKVKNRIKESGIRVAMEVDHGWCKSIYVIDPNGITLEYSYNVTPAEKVIQSHEEAYRLLFELPADQIGAETEKARIKQ